MPHGKKEYLYAYRIKNVFCLYIYLKVSTCNGFLLGSIFKFEYNALCIITTLLFDLLSSKVSKFSDFTIGVTLVRCEYTHM